jgi:hypothetical protein
MGNYTTFADWIKARPLTESGDFTGKRGAMTVFPLNWMRSDEGVGVALKFKTDKGETGVTGAIKDEKGFRSMGSMAKDAEGRVAWQLKDVKGDTYLVMMSPEEEKQFVGQYKQVLAHLAKARFDPNSTDPKVTGMDPDTGQILDEPKNRAERAAAPVDASQSSSVKIKQALNAWVNKIMAHPNNSKIEPERLVKSKSFQDLLDSVGLVGTANAEMREKATSLTISDLRNKQAQVRDFAAKKSTTSGPTATPAAAVPVAKPADDSGGIFSGWMKKLGLK